MPTFDFKSPGYAASQAIQELLTQRAIEKRQAMIDQLAEQDMRKKWANQDTQNEFERQRLGYEGQDVGFCGRNVAVNEGQLGVNRDTANANIANQAADNLRANVPLIPQGRPPESITNEDQRKFMEGLGLFVPQDVPQGQVDVNVPGVYPS